MSPRKSTSRYLRALRGRGTSDQLSEVNDVREEPYHRMGSAMIWAQTRAPLERDDGD